MRQSSYASEAHGATIERGEFGSNGGLEWALWLDRDGRKAVVETARTLKGLKRIAQRQHNIPESSWQRVRIEVRVWA